ALYDLLVKWKAQQGQNPPNPTVAPTVVNPATPTPTPTPTAIPNNPATATPTATATPMATATAVATNTPAPPTATPTQAFLPGIFNKTLQQGVNGYTGVSDTNLYNWSVNSNNGSNSSLSTSSNKGEKSLIRFDLASIPASSTVQSATLQLFLSHSDATAGTRASELHKLNVDWLEMQATHSLRKTGVAWSGNGPQPNSDYVTSAAAVAHTGSKDVWVTWNVTSLVQDWVNNPASNNGVLMFDPAPYANSNQGGYMRAYRSSNYWLPAMRPKLNVVYATP
nr:DNRLRE domain-containing protein [Anaerolineae bacterium]